MRNMIKLAWPLLSFAVLVAAQPAAADRSSGQNALTLQEWTEDWEGIWEFHRILKDCDTGIVLFEGDYPDTACAGETFSPPQSPEGPAFDCPVFQIDTDSFHAECSGSYEAFPGCTANSAMVIDATRNGDSVSGTQTINTTFVGDCGLEDMCQLFEFTGTRTDPNPPCTATPATPTSWGSLKSRYF